MLTVHLSDVAINVSAAVADHIHITAYTAIDHAYQLGYSAAMETIDYEDVFPSADLTPVEAEAFRAGARDGYRQLEHERDQAFEDAFGDDDCVDIYQDWLWRQEHRNAFIGHDATEQD